MAYQSGIIEAFNKKYRLVLSDNTVFRYSESFRSHLPIVRLVCIETSVSFRAKK